MAVLYQVEQQGRQTAFVGEDGTGLVGLYPLLARAAAITENENNSFAEALSLAAAERGTPLRRVFADEAAGRCSCASNRPRTSADYPCSACR